MNKNDAWFVPLYQELYPTLTGMARRYSSVWGVARDDLLQVAGFALWTSCARYVRLPFDQQLRLGNTIARRTMLRWCESESHAPTYLGTAGSLPWFAGEEGGMTMTVPEEER